MEDFTETMDMISLTLESFAGEENRHDLTHWHDQIELIRVTQGLMHCVTNGEDHVLQEGDICIINRQQLHRISCEDMCCAFQRLLIDPVLFTSDKHIYQRYLVPVLTDQTFAHVKIGKRDATGIAHLMDRMVELTGEAPDGYELEMIALVYHLFHRLFIIYQAEKGKRAAPANADLVLFRRMADLIYRRYPEKITLDEIAAAASISKSKCGSVFKEYAGHTPVDFLNLYRLKCSADLLISTHQSIAEIAASTGFGQQSYYNRLFLREYGMTPKEYRARHASPPSG